MVSFAMKSRRSLVFAPRSEEVAANFAPDRTDTTVRVDNILWFVESQKLGTRIGNHEDRAPTVRTRPLASWTALQQRFRRNGGGG
jgi:hypothetical protein